RERHEAEERELSKLFTRALDDRPGLAQFFRDTGALVGELTQNQPSLYDETRILHTIKGNCGLFGVETLATLCHTLEDRIAEERFRLTDAELRQLAQRWEAVHGKVIQLLGPDLDQELFFDNN